MVSKRQLKTKRGSGYGVIGHPGDRIRMWRKSKIVDGKTMRAGQLAKLLHISQGSLSDIENNNSFPSADTVACFYRWAHLNPAWLLMGKGPMVAMPDDDKELLGSDPVLNNLVERVIQIYKDGSDAQKAKLSGYVSGMESTQ